MAREYNFVNLHPSFTAAELDVCEYLLEGLTSSEIATKMGNAPSTVDTHRSNIIKKGREISPALDKALKVATHLRSRGQI